MGVFHIFNVSLLLVVVTMFVPIRVCGDEVMLEWHCKCFKTQDDCAKNMNGIPFTNITVPLRDKSCRQTNLTCYGRHFSSWQQGNRGSNGLLYFMTTDYCNLDVRDASYNVNECRRREIDVTDIMIGCYVVNKMEGIDDDLPLLP